MIGRGSLAGLGGIALTVAGLLVGLSTYTAGVPVIDPATDMGLPDPAAAAPPATPGPAPSTSSAQPFSRADSAPVRRLPAPDPRWVHSMSLRTGIGGRALTAYAAADLRATGNEPACHLSWATLAGVGWVESQHGTIGGRSLGPDGRPGITPIIGVELSGGGAVAAIADSDGGRLDGDVLYDRAVGPMQFLPSTWRTWGSDGDGDGVADPQDLDDAAWSAARYLCAGGGSLNQPVAWTRAVLSYNASAVYVADVVAATNAYSSRAWA